MVLHVCTKSCSATQGWVPIADLRPTQITLGLREVARKRLRWRSRQAVGCLAAPVVLGPSGMLYLVDRHHWVRALLEEGLTHLRVRPVADLRDIAPHRFWPALDARGWCHPYDGDGRRRPFREIPPRVDALRDDPYRSLASALRRAGGFAKTSAPFSEFVWADFLRRQIPRSTLDHDFDASLAQALELVHGPAARDLPGWRPAPARGTICSAAALLAHAVA